MEMLRQAILQALEDKYNAQISEADATIKIYLEKPVGIGEHPQHLEEIDKLLQKIVDAQEKIKKVVKALKKASKAHAGQAKMLKGVINGKKRS